MPAAHFLGLRPRLVFAQYPDDLLLAEATPFHRPSPFSGDGLYLISAEFSGCRPLLACNLLLADAFLEICDEILLSSLSRQTSMTVPNLSASLLPPGLSKQGKPLERKDFVDC